VGPRALLDHSGQERGHAVDDAHQVDVDGPPPVLLGGDERVAPHEHPGVVAEDVDGAEAEVVGHFAERTHRIAT
jgi:hypothetical protein